MLTLTFHRTTLTHQLLEQQQTGSGESELKVDDFNSLLILESDATSTGTALS